MKVVYILPVLGKCGGAERIVTEKANYLAEKFGYEIYILSTCSRKKVPHIFILFPN